MFNPSSSQSAASVQQADRLDSVRPGHRGECNGPEEAPSATSGLRDAVAAAPGSDPIPSRQSHRGTGSSPDPQFLNPGPSCRANKGSSSSIPYIDCSDIDSECDVTKSSGAPRGHGGGADEPRVCNSDQRGSGRDGGQGGSLFAAVNGFYHTNHQGLLQQGRPGRGSAVEQRAASVSASHELTDDEIVPNGGSFHGRLPLHSTLLDEIFQGREKRGGSAGRPLGTGTRSQCSSPVISSFHHRTNSLSHGEATDGQPRAPRWDDGGHYFSKRPGTGETLSVPPPPPPLPLNHYGSYSPITSNRTPPHFATPYHHYNNNNVPNRSDTDPFVLSRLSSTPAQRPDPRRSGTRDQAPCSAPVARRVVVTNGNPAGHLVVPGQPRPSAVQRLFGRQGKPGADRGNLNQTVQMADGSSSSGSDSSDSESDAGSGGGAYSQPLTYGNPAAVGCGNSVNSNGVSSSPLPRSRFAFGSLRSGEGPDGGEEEEGEEGCYRFNEEDTVGRVFSC